MTVIFDTIVRIFSFFIAIIQLLNIDFSSQTVDVELYATPSSGYSWEYSMDKVGYMMLVSTDYQSDSGSAIPGKGGGTKIFTFKSIRSGTVNITFRYSKLDGLTEVVATEYIYTYYIDKQGNISLVNIQ